MFKDSLKDFFARLGVLFVIMFILLGVALPCGWFDGCVNKPQPGRTETDTIYISDTTFIEEPICVHDTLLKWKTICLRDTIHDSIPLPIVNGDSISIPIAQREYTDDSTYRAWISGYDPVLDSIRVYNKTVVINTKEYIDNHKIHFGWGLQGGVGYGLITRKPDIWLGIGGCLTF